MPALVTLTSPPKSIISEAEREAYQFGDCWLLANTLHRMMGWDVWGIGRKDEDNTAEAHDPTSVAWYHLFVKTEKGDFLDIAGVSTGDALLAYHGVDERYAFLFQADMKRWKKYIKGQSPLYRRVSKNVAETAQHLVDWYSSVS